MPQIYISQISAWGEGWRQLGAGVKDRRFPDSVANSCQTFPASLAGKNLAAKTIIWPLGNQSFEGISTVN
jgi:hypothetical protein